MAPDPEPSPDRADRRRDVDGADTPRGEVRSRSGAFRGAERPDAALPAQGRDEGLAEQLALIHPEFLTRDRADVRFVPLLRALKSHLDNAIQVLLLSPEDPAMVANLIRSILRPISAKPLHTDPAVGETLQSLAQVARLSHAQETRVRDLFRVVAEDLAVLHTMAESGEALDSSKPSWSRLVELYARRGYAEGEIPQIDPLTGGFLLLSTDLANAVPRIGHLVRALDCQRDELRLLAVREAGRFGRAVNAGAPVAAGQSAPLRAELRHELVWLVAQLGDQLGDAWITGDGREARLIVQALLAFRRDAVIPIYAAMERCTKETPPPGWALVQGARALGRIGAEANSALTYLIDISTFDAPGKDPARVQLATLVAMVRIAPYDPRVQRKLKGTLHIAHELPDSFRRAVVKLCKRFEYPSSNPTDDGYA